VLGGPLGQAQVKRAPARAGDPHQSRRRAPARVGAVAWQAPARRARDSFGHAGRGAAAAASAPTRRERRRERPDAGRWLRPGWARAEARAAGRWQPIAGARAARCRGGGGGSGHGSFVLGTVVVRWVGKKVIFKKRFFWDFLIELTCGTCGTQSTYANYTTSSPESGSRYQF
jgi:hypothetical protein